MAGGGEALTTEPAARFQVDWRALRGSAAGRRADLIPVLSQPVTLPRMQTGIRQLRVMTDYSADRRMSEDQICSRRRTGVEAYLVGSGAL